MKHWDFSALVSRLGEAPDSAGRGALLREDPSVVNWQGIQAECASVLNRLHRERALEAGELTQSLKQRRIFSATRLEILPTQRVRNRALRMLQVHSLGSADVLQLVAALKAAREDPLTLDTVCSDTGISVLLGPAGKDKAIAPSAKVMRAGDSGIKQGQATLAPRKSLCLGTDGALLQGPRTGKWSQPACRIQSQSAAPAATPPWFQGK